MRYFFNFMRFLLKICTFYAEKIKNFARFIHKFYVNSKFCADVEVPHLTKRNEVSLVKNFRRKFF